MHLINMFSSHTFHSPVSFHVQESVGVAILAGKALKRHRRPKDSPFFHARGGMPSLEAKGASAIEKRAKDLVIASEKR